MTDFLVTETQITYCAWLVKATSEEHAREVWEGSGPDVQLVDQQVTDSQGLTITEGAGGYQWPAGRGGDPWAALEAAQFWLQEEAASERPGQTKPDDILRVIGDALAGRPMAPLTSDLVKPDLASQLRFLAGIIGTHSQQGRNEARQTVAYVEGVAAQLLEALQLAAERVEMNNYGGEEDEALAQIKSAISAAQGKEG